METVTIRLPVRIAKWFARDLVPLEVEWLASSLYEGDDAQELISALELTQRDIEEQLPQEDE